MIEVDAALPFYNIIHHIRIKRKSVPDGEAAGIGVAGVLGGFIPAGGIPSSIPEKALPFIG